MITLFIRPTDILATAFLILVCLNGCSFIYQSYFVFSYDMSQASSIAPNESNDIKINVSSYNDTKYEPDDKDNTTTTKMSTFISRLNDNSSLSQNDSDGIKMSTCDLSCNMPNSNIQRYIDELSNSSPDEISTFPINDLDPSIVVQVLNGLSIDNLYKVLHELYQDDLNTLLTTTLTKSQGDQILNKLSLDKKNEILDLIK